MTKPTTKQKGGIVKYWMGGKESMLPYRGRRPAIGWSVHMTEGWQAQLDRLRRWYGRASNATDSIDRWDYVYAFFENALHLRNWLSDTGTVSEVNLKKFFEANEEMRLCRDLADSTSTIRLVVLVNLLRHRQIREYSPGDGNLNSDASLMILSDGKKYDAFDLAKRILQLWEAFIPPNTK
jgi:hypothetical protein